jgi:hypothetical protein
MRSTFVLLLFCTIMFCAVGCVPPAIYLAENYEQVKPRSIAIFPVTDEFMKDEDTMDMIATLEETVADKDYDVVRMKTAELMLKKNSVSRLVDTTQAGIARVCSTTSSDAVLYLSLESMDKTYAVLGRSDELHMGLVLFDRKGTPLWRQLIDEKSVGLGLLGALESKVDGWIKNYTRSLPDGAGSGQLR